MSAVGLRDFSHIHPPSHTVTPRGAYGTRSLTAMVVVALVTATTAISLYDLYLFLTLVVR
jgi:hypothetical protein